MWKEGVGSFTKGDGFGQVDTGVVGHEVLIEAYLFKEACAFGLLYLLPEL